MTTVESDGLIADVSSWTWIHWTGVLLSLCIAAINLYVGYTAGQSQFFAVGGSFFLGGGLYASRFWNPILYLVGVLHVAVLGVLWILDGMRFPLFGVASGGLSVALAAIAVYLFFEEGFAPDR
jgi:hypothetical protein